MLLAFHIAQRGLELRLGRALDTLLEIASEGRGPFDLLFGLKGYDGFALAVVTQD